MTAIEMGDLDCGYRAIDITGKDVRLYSLTSPLYLEALDDPRGNALSVAAAGHDGQG